jgi:hypothetical protein
MTFVNICLFNNLQDNIRILNTESFTILKLLEKNKKFDFKMCAFSYHFLKKMNFAQHFLKMAQHFLSGAQHFLPK